MTDQEILNISAQFGTINDFGKTFFTDDELIDFAHEVIDKISILQSENIKRNDYENNIAMREAHHIHDADAYFNARPQIAGSDRRKVFEAGYERGWQARAQLNTKPTNNDALDAERWRYFVETCSSEAGFELTGITDASNDEINAAIDAAMREVK